MRKPSDKTIRALRIIAACPGLPPGDFARRMWDVSSWKWHSVGLVGGQYLGTLRKMGLVGVGDALTAKGQEVLDRASAPEAS